MVGFRCTSSGHCRRSGQPDGGGGRAASHARHLQHINGGSRQTHGYHVDRTRGQMRGQGAAADRELLQVDRAQVRYIKVYNIICERSFVALWYAVYSARDEMNFI